jgi:hypothetical protein
MAITYDATVTESWITYEAVWHTAMDERTCTKCMQLEGQTWTFPELKGPLIDSRFGPVYNLDNDEPLTHKNCRCFLEIRPIVELEKSDVFQSLNMMFQEVNMQMPSNIAEATEQVDKLRANFGQARGELREMEYILYRTTSLLNRMGLPPAIDQGIQKIERMIMTIRILHSTMVLFEIGTPEGWILGLISGISAAISISDLMLSSP